MDDASNVTFKKSIRMTPYRAMYGEKKDVSEHLALGCRTWIKLDLPRQAVLIKGKAHANGKKTIYLGFVLNMSAWAISVQWEKNIMVLDQVKFD